MQFEIVHTLPADPDTVMRVMQERAYYEYLQQHHPDVDRIEMLSLEDRGATVQRRVHYQPKPIIKSVGPKKVPPEAMAWVEESTLDKAARRLTFRNVPVKDWVQERMSNSGTIELRDAGGGQTRRVVSGELKIRFPLLGAIAERVVYGKAKEILDGEARLFAEYLKTRG
ncbi:MAG: DUF2505 family protein [Myxococcales bacterium]|nr:DUF2505 family protein [Myxococcales bacterium]